MRHFILLAILMVPNLAAAEGDPLRGGKTFRACVACHALEPGVHLSGPSLSGFIDRTAGTADNYSRYSPGLKAAGFEWNTSVLDAWLEDPKRMVPDTYMSFSGISDSQIRADLIAFLEIAGARGGVEKAVARNLVPAEWTRAGAPDPIGNATPDIRIVSIRHCGDGYIIKTEDGVVRPHWEKNVRLKLDSTGTGPPKGVPVVLRAGMRGDRISVIFRNVTDLSRFLIEDCQ